VWAIAIFSFSTERFASTASESLLVVGFAAVGVTVPAPALDTLNSLSRILAHLTEYAIFAVLLYISLWKVGGSHWRPRLAVRCIAISAAYGLTDEFHQVFVRGRGPSLADSSLDALGATLAMAVVYGCCRWFYRNTRNRVAS